MFVDFVILFCMFILKRLILLILLMLILGLAYMAFPSAPTPGPIFVIPDEDTTETPIQSSIPDSDNDLIFCTADAMQCPDGSFVGRSGPDCMFVCPVGTSSPSVPPPPVQSNNSSVILGLDQSGTINDLTITPIKIEQDSRCPSDVVCIQAGTVIASIKFFEDGIIDSAREVELGEPISIGSRVVTMTEVQPYPVSGRSVRADQYRFVFEVHDISTL